MADDRKDVLLAKLAAKAQVVQRVLATDDGREMMKILRAEFYNRLDKTQEEHSVVLNAGRMDVVAYIEMLNDFNTGR